MTKRHKIFTVCLKVFEKWLSNILIKIYVNTLTALQMQVAVLLSDANGNLKDNYKKNYKESVNRIEMNI